MIEIECRYCDQKFKQYASGQLSDAIKNVILCHYEEWHKYELIALVLDSMEDA